MSVSFNFKREKKVKEVVEKYSLPVLTQLSKQEEKKSVAKFKLNKALLDILQISGKDCSISVGQTDDGAIVLVNTTTIDTPHQSHVNADGTINNRFLLDRITRMYPISSDEEHEFSTEYMYEEGFHMAVITGILVQEEAPEITDVEFEYQEANHEENINEDNESLNSYQEGDSGSPMQDIVQEESFDEIPDEISEANVGELGLRSESNDNVEQF